MPDTMFYAQRQSTRHKENYSETENLDPKIFYKGSEDRLKVISSKTMFPLEL